MDDYLNVVDIEHKKCRAFLKGKKCEYCEKLFNNLSNKEGLYHEIENPPLILEENRKEFVRSAKGFVRTHMVCNKHFRIFRKENKKLNEAGIPIPSELILKKIRKSDI